MEIPQKINTLVPITTVQQMLGGVHRRTVMNMVSAGKFKAYRIGGRRLSFNLNEIDLFIASLTPAKLSDIDLTHALAASQKVYTKRREAKKLEKEQQASA